jgi:hypothetical protein
MRLSGAAACRAAFSRLTSIASTCPLPTAADLCVEASRQLSEVHLPSNWKPPENCQDRHVQSIHAYYSLVLIPLQFSASTCIAQNAWMARERMSVRAPKRCVGRGGSLRC